MKTRKLSFVGQQNVEFELQRLKEEGQIVPFKFNATFTTLCGEEVDGTVISSDIRQSGVEIRTRSGDLKLIGWHNMSMLTHDYRGYRSFRESNREVEEFVPA